MDIEEYHGVVDLLHRISSFIAKGHLDLDDVLVLQALQNGDAETPGDIVRQLGLSAPAVSRRVGKLRDLDLITEQVFPHDLRKCVLKPTVQCSSILHEILRAFPGESVEQALAAYRRYVADRARLSACLGDKGISLTKAFIIGALDAAGRPLGIGELARLTCCPQSSVSTAAAALKKQGLLRHPDPGESSVRDGRTVLLELTDAARHLLMAMQQ